QEERVVAVERAASLAVHEDLSVASELEVAQPLPRKLPLAALGNVRRKVAVHVDQAAADDGTVLVCVAIEDRADVTVSEIGEVVVVLNRVGLGTRAVVRVEQRVLGESPIVEMTFDQA